MKLIPIVIISLVVIFSSCSKDGLSCVARDAQGNAKYEVIGSDVCNDQVSSENGEYCDCMK